MLFLNPLAFSTLLLRHKFGIFRYDHHIWPARSFAITSFSRVVPPVTTASLRKCLTYMWCKANPPAAAFEVWEGHGFDISLQLSSKKSFGQFSTQIFWKKNRGVLFSLLNQRAVHSWHGENLDFFWFYMTLQGGHCPDWLCLHRIVRPTWRHFGLHRDLSTFVISCKTVDRDG